MNSKRKGKVGELELCSFLTDCGFPARRTQQFCGNTGDAADVFCPMLDDYHMEVKRTEKFALRATVKQCDEDGKGKPFIIWTRWNNGEWMACMKAEELLKLFRRVR